MTIEEDKELLAQLRRDVIRTLHENLKFASEEEKEASIESFCNSKMTTQEVKDHCDRVKHAQRRQRFSSTDGVL
jgi:hypothetical protein